MYVCMYDSSTDRCSSQLCLCNTYSLGSFTRPQTITNSDLTAPQLPTAQQHREHFPPHTFPAFLGQPACLSPTTTPVGGAKVNNLDSGLLSSPLSDGG